ncbi:hypothetical protein DICPUDRAFT_51398 [Dictyostelium purpureum]|uniref:Uncharacterized protein n=1 Tax=Dictyostelium purpureum TaxID=5786 RepID=F1A3K7_DICPU|nr:uncharacterized protein DICPUDRAFT_51398 [Dictyostelium purpureum]EGC29230.1 hypothetical protein DICPUDRAFT_51398 [Dictyostelium purpureum]|eukprot:XP_003294252.1 hypothetical protein DICPUDRAFT_51398 [Dictyostelium purpureum]
MTGRFNQKFKAYPISFLPKEKHSLESGGKILLPPSSLNTLSRLNIQYPMLFEISNPITGRTSHCGVLEFTAEEGVCYLPYWMMQNLGLNETDFIDIKSATLPKGTFVKIQPRTSNFLDISNPKAVLENSLRKFATLTKDEEIMIDYNNNKYYLKVVEIKPANAISIIEADVSVDFAPPMDAKESQNPTPSSSQPASKGLTFGSGSSAPKLIPGKKKKDDSDSDSDSDSEEPKFKAFGGSGARLDGKISSSPKTSSPTSTTPTNTSYMNKAAPNNNNNNNSTNSDNSDRFKSFSGKGYSLKD